MKPGVIKGLLPFGYEDAEDFTHLQRGQNLKECLQAIVDEQWRFGVLSGESGAGQDLFPASRVVARAGEAKGELCVRQIQLTFDLFESVRRACRKHLPSSVNGATEGRRFSKPVDCRHCSRFFAGFIAPSTSSSNSSFTGSARVIRVPFVQVLARWFTEMDSLPVKLLICIRGDFHDRLYELQMVMRYSLGPTQSFRLKRFEPDQATEALCFMARKEGSLFYGSLEMTRQDLADTEDGLIPPVDVQALARMIQTHKLLRKAAPSIVPHFRNLAVLKGCLTAI